MKFLSSFTVGIGALALFSAFSAEAFAQNFFPWGRRASAETQRAMAAVEAQPEAANATSGVKRAFMVGVNDYAEFADLKYAADDVEALRAQLLKRGFDAENIVTMTSQSQAAFLPTQRNIERQLDAFLAAAEPNDLLLLYFAGHGFQSKDNVQFAPIDAVATNDKNVVDSKTAISLTKIVARLEAAKSTRKILIVDACRENPTESRNAAASELTLKNVDARPGVLVLQSCSAGEFSREDEQAGHGLFTGRLLAALDGQADANADGALSALEICRFASAQTAAASRTRFHASQTPRFNNDVADFIFVDLTANVGTPEEDENDGPTAEDLERAEALYNASLESAQMEKFDDALSQIREALKIVVELPEADETKERYQQRYAMINSLVLNASGAIIVSNSQELIDAIENAENDVVIALEDGTYRLSQGFTIRNTSLTLVGKSGDREKVKISFALTPSEMSHSSAFAVSGGEVNLTDVSVFTQNRRDELRGAHIIQGGYTLNATRCNLTSPGGFANGTGHISLHECCLLEGSAASRLSALLRPTFFLGGITAEDCKFTTSGISLASASSSFKNCEFHSVPQQDAATLHLGDFSSPEELASMSAADRAELQQTTNRLRATTLRVPAENMTLVTVTMGGECDFIDCRFYAGERALYCAGAQVNVRGGEIQTKSTGACVHQDGALTLNDVKFVDCSIGVDLGGDSSSCRCDATNVTFDNVKTKWDIDSESSATLDGRPVAPANNRRYY